MSMNRAHLRRLAQTDPKGEPFDRYSKLEDGEWKWFGTLSCPNSPSCSAALRLYFRWFNEIEATEGRIGWMNWVRVEESGSFGTRFYVLFSGTKIADRRTWINRWHKIGGEGALCDYRPGEFFHYVLRKAEPTSRFDIHMDICGDYWIFPTQLIYR